MARKIGKITADVGSYQGQDGQEKTRWSYCGTMFENNGKLSCKMETFPVGPDWSGWFRIFLDDGLSISIQGQAQPRQRQQGGQQKWQGQHPRKQQAPQQPQDYGQEAFEDEPF